MDGVKQAHFLIITAMSVQLLRVFVPKEVLLTHLCAQLVGIIPEMHVTKVDQLLLAACQDIHRTCDVSGIELFLSCKIRLVSRQILVIGDFVSESPLLNPFRLHCVDSNDPEITVSFHEIHDNESHEKLHQDQIYKLSNSLGFKTRWLDTDWSSIPKIAIRLRKAADHPESIQIEFAWNRIIIRDFLKMSLDYFYSPSQSDRFRGPFFSGIFKNSIAPLLFTCNCGFLHASGTCFADGYAALFLAPDSGGKTTIIKHFAPGNILSDDQVGISFRAGKFGVFPTPFGTMFNPNANGLLGGLFFLQKANSFEINAISANKAFEIIWNEHEHYWHQIPIVYRKGVFTLIHDLCLSVPCYQLSFSPDHIDKQAIEDALKK